MPKKILHESAIHQFLWASQRLRLRVSQTAPTQADALAQWLKSLAFENPGAGSVLISWTAPAAGCYTLDYRGARFYTRGDAGTGNHKQADDDTMDANRVYFDNQLRATLTAARVFDPALLAAAFSIAANPGPLPHDRKRAEEVFHDEWAGSEDISQINVRQRNEACTAPEMRHIRKKLGDLRGKTLLDVGCGLGEAAVYFAMEGATVTGADISSGMCESTRKLALANGVTLETHVSPSEDLGLGTRQFDIIYTGNTLHHADLVVTLDNILPHLKPDGIFVSWDPIAYNPIINLYRVVTNKVRTEDEYPLRLSDVREITSRFQNAEVTWFWLTTLLIFILMVVVQFRSPNQERFWKKVIDEADTWAWLYRPLAAFDRFLLALLPFLGPLCWNVVIIARHPRKVQ